ncbi:MAG TPA: hypothetical protein VM123_08130 [archaeon]|nr:hypothetical protein [archaeon]
MVYYYSIMAVLGLCLIVFLILLIQRKREEEKRRRQMELLTAQRRLEESREKLNHLRKKLYETENQLNENTFFFKSKKEELIQLAKQLQEVEAEKDSIQAAIDQGAPSDKERNLLNNRLNLTNERFTELRAKATELQEEVDSIKKKALENEQGIKLLQEQTFQAESELNYFKETVKIKERMIKALA